MFPALLKSITGTQIAPSSLRLYRELQLLCITTDLSGVYASPGSTLRISPACGTAAVSLCHPMAVDGAGQAGVSVSPVTGSPAGAAGAARVPPGPRGAPRCRRNGREGAAAGDGWEPTSCRRRRRGLHLFPGRPGGAERRDEWEQLQVKSAPGRPPPEIRRH